MLKCGKIGIAVCMLETFIAAIETGLLEINWKYISVWYRIRCKTNMVWFCMGFVERIECIGCRGSVKTINLDWIPQRHLNWKLFTIEGSAWAKCRRTKKNYHPHEENEKRSSNGCHQVLSHACDNRFQIELANTLFTKMSHCICCVMCMLPRPRQARHTVPTDTEPSPYVSSSIFTKLKNTRIPMYAGAKRKHSLHSLILRWWCYCLVVVFVSCFDCHVWLSVVYI